MSFASKRYNRMLSSVCLAEETKGLFGADQCVRPCLFVFTRLCDCLWVNGHGTDCDQPSTNSSMTVCECMCMGCLLQRLNEQQSSYNFKRTCVMCTSVIIWVDTG